MREKFLILALVLGMIGTVSADTVESFEDGSFDDSWTGDTGYWSAVQSGSFSSVPDGSWVAEMSDSGSNSHTVTRSVSSSSPDSLEAYAWVPGDVTFSKIDVAFTSGGTHIFEARVEPYSDRIAGYCGSSWNVDGSVEGKTWHNIEWRNIDWQNEVSDVYVNGNLVKEDVPFCSSADSIDGLDLYHNNGGSGFTGYVDFLRYGRLNTAPSFDSVSTTPSSWSLGEAVDFSYNVSDSDDTVENVTLEVFRDGSLQKEETFAYGSSSVEDTQTDWYTPTETGNYTVYFTAVDDAGAETVETLEKKIKDTTPPSVTIQSPENTTYSYSNVDLSVSANESVATWKYNLDNSGNASFTPNTTISGLSDGGHELTVYAEDSAGNTGSSSTSFSVDTTPPESTDNSSTGWKNEEKEVVEISATDSGGAVSNVTYSRDGESFQTVSGSTVELVFDTEGNHSLEYYATDEYGNVEPVQETFVALDRPPDWRNLEDNTSGSVPPGGSVNISAEFRDDGTGLSSAVLATNETGNWENKSGNYSSPHLFSGETGSFESSSFTWRNDSATGTISYQVWGEDEGGNWNNTETGSFDVNQAPVVDSFSTSTAETGGEITVDVTASDPDGNLDTVYLNLTDADGNTELQDASMTDEGGGSFSYTYSIDAEPSNVGDWALRLRPVDSSGASTSNTSTFTVSDGTAPVLRNLQDNATDQVGSGDVINISAEARDNDSGLSQAVLATNETGEWKNYSGTWETGETRNYTFNGASESDSKYNVDLTAGTYRIEVHGADGEGDEGGRGGFVNGTVAVNGDDNLEIWVGESPDYGSGGWGRHDGGDSGYSSSTAGGGGGSTELLLNGNLLAAADAGGGDSGCYADSRIAGGGGARGGAAGTGDYQAQDGEGKGLGGDGGDNTGDDCNSGEPGGDGGAEAGTPLNLDENITGGATKDSDGHGYVEIELVESKSSVERQSNISGATEEWTLADYLWQNSSFDDTLGYRVWTQDDAGHWNRSGTSSITFNLAPNFNEATLNWTGIGGDSEQRKLHYDVSDPDGEDIASRNSPPTGSVSSFTNSTYRISGLPGQFDYLASISDFAGASASYETNYITSKTGFREHSYSHTLSKQRINNTATLENRGESLNYSSSMTGPGTLVSGGSFSGSLATGETVEQTSVYESDFITRENETSVEFGQNLSKTSDIDTQYLYNQTGLEVYNDRNYSFSNVDLSTQCSVDTLSDVPSGAGQITSQCNNRSISGDWIQNEENSSTEYVSGDVVFGDGLDNTFTASQDVEVTNVRTDLDLSVDLSPLLSHGDICNSVNDTVQNVERDSVQSFTFDKSCNPGTHLNRTSVTKTETSDFYKYEIDFWFEINSNLAEEEETEYAVKSSWVDNWNSRDPTETEALIDGSGEDISIDERIINDTEYIVFVIGDQHTNSSIHTGTHSATLTYYEDKTPGSTSGGSSSSGSSTTLLSDGRETQVDEVTSDKYNWTLSAITSQDSQKFQVSGYPGATFERYVVVRNTGDRNVTLDIECVSIEDECSWVETSVDRVVLNRNDFTEKQVKVNGTIPPGFGSEDAPAQFSIRVSDPEFNGSQSGPHVGYVDFTVTNSPFLGRALDAAMKGLQVRTFESPFSWGYSLPYFFIFVPLLWSVLVNVLWSTGEWLVSMSDRNRQWSTNLKWISTIAVFFLTYILL